MGVGGHTGGMQWFAAVEVGAGVISTQVSCSCVVQAVPWTEAEKAWHVAELHMAGASMQQLYAARIILNTASQLQQRVVAGTICPDMHHCDRQQGGGLLGALAAQAALTWLGTPVTQHRR